MNPAEQPKSIMVEKPKKGGRQLVIGDVHGCHRTLEKLLEKIDLKKRDQLYFLGDLVNRGPDSARVIDLVMDLQERHKSVFIMRGNHEQILLEAAEDSKKKLGEVAEHRNVLMLLNKKGELKKRYKRFIEGTLHFIELDEFYLVHAGFNLKRKNPLADPHAMLWKRPFKPKKKLNGKRIIYGHNPRRWQDIKQALALNLPHIGLDNGCVHYDQLNKKYGRLVCIDLGSMKLIKQRNCERH